MTNLTAFTDYVVTVSAVSSGGVGPKALTIARTDEAGKIDCLSISCLVRNVDYRILRKCAKFASHNMIPNSVASFVFAT